MTKLLRRVVDLTLDGLCASTMGAIVLVTFFQVGNRYILQYPVGWTDEIARFLAVWVVMLGAARCVREDSHIYIDLFFNLFGPRGQWWLSLIVNTLFMALAGILIWQGLKIMPVIGKQTAAASRITMTWVYSAVPVAAGIIAFYLIERYVVLFKAARNPKAQEHREMDLD